VSPHVNSQYHSSGAYLRENAPKASPATRFLVAATEATATEATATEATATEATATEATATQATATQATATQATRGDQGDRDEATATQIRPPVASWHER
jgi:hypothetical protein